jgi:hypothetical protein
MAIVILEVNVESTGRPSGCPNCGSAILQGWGAVPKPLRDPQHQEVRVHRLPRIYNQPMHPLARLQKLLLRLSDNCAMIHNIDTPWDRMLR